MNNELEKLYQDRLNALKIENGEITEIKFLEEVKSPLSSDGMLMNDIPERCEVYATLRPTKNSDIKIVVGFPLENWNGRFLGTGNGGAAGSLVMQEVNAGVARFFATANTDMGTTPDEKMCNNSDRWVDFGHRATHLMTVVGKQITEAFYDRKIERSYFIGGSTGGGQGLHEAQRYPDDYDGIVSICPANNRVNTHQAFVWELQATCSDEKAAFTNEQIAAVRNRVLERYAEKSGSAPGDQFLSYPGKINFEPDDVYSLFDGLGLTDTQLNVLKQLHNFPNVPGTDKHILPPLPLGCESSALILSSLKVAFEKLLVFLHRWCFGCDFKWQDFDFNEGYLQMVEALRNDFDATNPDLSVYKKCGHKLILITGSVDSLINYADVKNYYASVVDKMGGIDNVTDFFRYFHVPGLAHCAGGPGLQEIGNTMGLPCIPCDREHDALEAVIAWVEQGVAPDVLLPVALKDSVTENSVSLDGTIRSVTGGKEIDYERPVYPYPYETEYIGGDRKNKDSFRKKLGNGVY